MRIVIFGTVGAGKTTVSKRLSEVLGYDIFPEPIEKNPYFEEYYQDIKATVFKMQIYMLTARMIQLKAAKEFDNIIFDRSILEDPIFMKVNHDLKNINDIDYQTYNNFYKHVILENLQDYKKENMFDLVVYLKVDSKKAIERIKERDIKSELSVGNEYWEILNKNYEQFYNDNKSWLPFYIVDSNSDDLESKINMIINKINEIKNERGKL